MIFIQILYKTAKLITLLLSLLSEADFPLGIVGSCLGRQNLGGGKFCSVLLKNIKRSNI
jgi:hypothetical protein